MKKIIKATDLIERIRLIINGEYKDFNIKVGDKLGKHNIIGIDIDGDNSNNLILITDL